VTPPAAPAGRPRGVAILGYFLLGIAGALFFFGLQVVIATVMMTTGKAENRSIWPPLLPVLLGLILPAIWVGTAGWGLLKGHPWSRSLVAAVAVLWLVIFAGTASPAAIKQTPVRFGAILAILLSFGGATWYLFSDRTRDWFSSKSG
jgi:hypothetical protein